MQARARKSDTAEAGAVCPSAFSCFQAAESAVPKATKEAAPKRKPAMKRDEAGYILDNPILLSSVIR